MKIGRLIDYPSAASGVDYVRLSLDMLLEDVNAVGGLHGEALELVDEDAIGSVERVTRGAHRLVAAGCVLILGPAVTDFAVPLLPVLDQLEVAGINWSGSGLARSAWGFQLKVGSLPDEAGHLVRIVAAKEWRRVTVVRDRGMIGTEYFTYLHSGLDALGATLVEDVEVDRDAEIPVASFRHGSPECIVYLGFGPTGVALCRAIRALGWRVPMIATVGIGVHASADIEGVIFTDVVDDTNPVLRQFRERYAKRHGGHPPLLGLAAAHDLGATAVAAIRGAPAPTPAGVRTGLERIRGLPAACGAPGTAIAFGPWDRDGYKGPLVVYHQVVGGRATPLPL